MITLSLKLYFKVKGLMNNRDLKKVHKSPHFFWKIDIRTNSSPWCEKGYKELQKVTKSGIWGIDWGVLNVKGM